MKRVHLARMTPIACVCLAALLAVPANASAKSYSADRFESIVRMLADGTLDITETVLFHFEDGTFKEVFREIPLRHTDGVDVLDARMQGNRMPFGTETGTVEVRRRTNHVRVIWRFSPIERVTREFVVNYRVRGAVRQTDEADVFAWRAIPGEHPYDIASASIRFELAAIPSGAPEVTTRRTAEPRVRVADNIVAIEATGVRSNGWIEASMAFPRGAIAAAPPVWQQHAVQVAAQSPIWMISAAVVAGAGLILLFAWRQSYDSPPGDGDMNRGDSYSPVLPDTLAPAIAGVLAANGRARLEHAMAALVSLADRGEIDIQEKPRSPFGQRDFVISRHGATVPAFAHERAALDVVFKPEAPERTSVTLSQARSRLTWKFRRFKAEMERELESAGLLDASRKSIRDRYNLAGMWLLIAGGVAVVPMALLIPQRGAWPMLIPAAIIVVGITAFIFGATITPLSNDGVHRAQQWRQYRRHLHSMARGQSAAGIPAQSVLPFAIALGLADAWSKFLTTQGHVAPAWFHALPASDAHGAFPAFIATSGAGASSGGVHGGTGAAGGGASGAR